MESFESGKTGGTPCHPLRSHAWRCLVAVLIVAGVAAACSSDDAAEPPSNEAEPPSSETAVSATLECGAADAPTPTLQVLHEAISAVSCFPSPCHGGSRPNPTFAGMDGQLPLKAAEDWCKMIDRPAVTDTMERPLITCGDCDNSYLMIKMDPARRSEITTAEAYEDFYETEATLMPQAARGMDGAPLCDAKLAGVCQWIDEGCNGCP